MGRRPKLENMGEQEARGPVEQGPEEPEEGGDEEEEPEEGEEELE